MTSPLTDLKPLTPARAISPDDITGLILCGGAGSRMGGVDKGLLDFHGKALIDIAIEKLRPEVCSLVISANRNHQNYATRGFQVLKDADFQDDGPNYEGPLAGILSGLELLKTQWLLVIPCDVPRFPVEIIRGLIQEAERTNAGSYVSAHPTFAMVPKTAQQALENYLRHGKRKLGDWLIHIQATPITPISEELFKNLNTPQDLVPD